MLQHSLHGGVLIAVYLQHVTTHLMYVILQDKALHSFVILQDKVFTELQTWGQWGSQVTHSATWMCATLAHLQYSVALPCH